MSLINEALKRTRDASYQSVAVPPAIPPSYQIQGNVKPCGAKGTLFVTALVAVVAIAGIVALASRIVPSFEKLKEGLASSANVTIAETTRPAPQAPPASMPGKVETPGPTQAPPTPALAQTPPTSVVDPKVFEDQLVTRVMDKIKAEQAATAPKPALPEPPKLVLQGITYAADGSEAMINGVSVRVGEDIEGGRVVAIDRRSVKLDFDGREIVLRLP